MTLAAFGRSGQVEFVVGRKENLLGEDEWLSPLPGIVDMQHRQLLAFSNAFRDVPTGEKTTIRADHK